MSERTRNLAALEECWEMLSLLQGLTGIEIEFGPHVSFSLAMRPAIPRDYNEMLITYVLVSSGVWSTPYSALLSMKIMRDTPRYDPCELCPGALQKQKQKPLDVCGSKSKLQTGSRAGM